MQLYSNSCQQDSASVIQYTVQLDRTPNLLHISAFTNKCYSK